MTRNHTKAKIDNLLLDLDILLTRGNMTDAERTALTEASNAIEWARAEKGQRRS